MFYELIDKIQSNPIIEYLADEVTQISEVKIVVNIKLNNLMFLLYFQQIPFPAVSYCPEIRTIIGDFNYVEIIDKINKNEMKITELSDEK